METCLVTLADPDFLNFHILQRLQNENLNMNRVHTVPPHQRKNNVNIL
jgi:hypothetical protein